MDKELIYKAAHKAGWSEYPPTPLMAKVFEAVAAFAAEECAKEAEAAIDPEWPNDDQSVQAQNIAAAIRAKFPPVEGV